jgi:hypothetical protein
MLLSELKWDYPSDQAHNRAEVRTECGTVIVWRQFDGTYNIYTLWPKADYERLDPITAQAVLYHLTTGAPDHEA